MESPLEGQPRLVGLNPALELSPKVGDRRFVNVALARIDLDAQKQAGTCQSGRIYDFTSGTEARTLSSETFQLRILAFGGSAVHCG